MRGRTVDVDLLPVLVLAAPGLKVSIMPLLELIPGEMSSTEDNGYPRLMDVASSSLGA